MKLTKTMVLYGATVRGIDLRDGASFEDFAAVDVSESLQEDQIADGRELLTREYTRKGFHVREVIPERPVEVTIDLMKLWFRSREAEAASPQTEHTQDTEE